MSGTKGLQVSLIAGAGEYHLIDKLQRVNFQKGATNINKEQFVYTNTN